MTKYISSSATELGLKRTNNEDAFLDLPQAGIFAVSDGMGGAAAGEVASRIFIETVTDFFGSLGHVPENEAHQLVQDTFAASNQKIRESAAHNPSFAGMGCTADLLVFSGERFVVGHVGDSRIYIFRNESMLQLTKDHSLVQMQVDQGLLSPDEARRHARKNVLLRALGTDAVLSVDVMRGTSYPNDLFLLCSDGLTDMVDDAQIKKVLASKKSLPEKVSTLIALTNSGGGRDNSTVVLCQVLDS